MAGFLLTAKTETALPPMTEAGTMPARGALGQHRHRRTDRVDVDALLIRPDGCVAWALPTEHYLDATTLVRALGTWFGQRPEHRINSRLRFAPYEVAIQISDATRM